MFKRFRLVVSLIPVMVAAAFFVMFGCGEKTSDTRAPEKTDSLATTIADSSAQPFQLVVDLPPDTRESLDRKIREIESWTPKQVEKIDFALKGVTRIVRFADLGLGDQIDIALPRAPSRDWPVVHSLRLNLGREITAVVTRFKLDTLPGPRARGEGFLGLMGIHGDTLFGRDIELPRTASSTGRFELLFLYDQLFFQMGCCDLPPTVRMARYGSVNDTLTLIFTFDPSEASYSISLIGSEVGRTYPGYYYHVFRTERGQFHRDVKGYPYLCTDRDSSYVNLFVGSRFRGRKNQLEPVLIIKMF